MNYLYEYDAVPASPPGGFYGATTYLYGKLTRDKVTYPALAGGATVERFFDYEWHGNASRQGDVFAGQTFLTNYAYFNASGGLRQETYPSGQVVTNAWAPGGVPGAIQLGATPVPVMSNLTYAAHLTPEQMTLTGTGTANWAESYNYRLWPQRIMAGPGIVPGSSPSTNTSVLLGLNYTGYEKNGNLTKVDRYLRTTAGQAAVTITFSYGYDKLNWLKSTYFQWNSINLTNPFKYAYDIDKFGNIYNRRRTDTVTTPPAPGTLTLPVDWTTNRLTGRTYDALGNQLDIGTGGTANRLVYFDQGHVLDLKNSPGTTLLYRYFYDTDGKRRIKCQATGGTVSLTSNCSYYFYEGEDLICQQDRGTQVQNTAAYDTRFLLLDHLGTTRAELKFTGTTPSIAQSYDPMPDGELTAPPATTTEQVLFTGKLKDIESGLDYFGARYYSNSLCRWLSADNPFEDNYIQNPQCWNLYSYVRNNPVMNVDPNGRWAESAIDVGFIVNDIHNISKEGFTTENCISLGGNIIGASLPIATGVGAGAKAGYKLAKSGEGLEELAQGFTKLEKNYTKVMEGISQFAKYRIPDLLSDIRKFVGEVKDVATLNLTRQLKDTFTYAKETGKQVGLFIGEKTKLSKNLIKRIEAEKARVYRYVKGKWVDVTEQVLKSQKTK